VTTSQADPILGRLIDGRYRVRSRIARGGMATVYLATDLRLERRVAIKIMHPHLADDAAFRARFIQEARSAARLAHPNVVNVFDQGQDDDSAYLVMEYLPGITLRELLQEYGGLTPEQTMDITEAVLSGLAAAHKAGIVHRDLKPENVLLADDGRIKIGDFGLARAATANTASGAALMGTIAYLSPELVTRGLADTRSDIYAVGIMMYEMLTGEQPYKGEQPMQIAYQHANDSVPTPSSASPRVPAELDELVLWATARDPEQRPRDARLLLEQLYETQEMLRTALPTGAVPTQRTKVLAQATAATTVLEPPVRTPSVDDETQVLAPRPAPGPGAAPPRPLGESATRLAQQSGGRRRRGAWLLALVLVLAGVAGGTGWYFGPGPGGNVTVPESLIGMPEADAGTRLTELGFTVGAPGTGFSLEHPAGTVMGTDPATGASLARGSEVSLVISQGAQPFPLPELTGIGEEDAVRLVEEHWTLADPIVRRFDAGVERGIVLEARGVDGQPLVTSADYLQAQPIALTVSAGAVPDIAGRSVDEANAILAEVGLPNVQEVARDYSETVPAGSVKELVTVRDGADIVFTEGQADAVGVVISDGPRPIVIPDGLVGETWSVVKQTLGDLGLTPRYNQLADTLPDLFVVSRVTPGEGVYAGDEVQVNFSSSF